MSIMLNQPEELNFDRDTHRYTVHGQVLPSVSQIMEPLSKDHYKGIPRDVLNNAADRGTAVHSAIELFLEYGVEDIDESLAGYLETFKDFASGHEIKPIALERRLYHKVLRYAGTVDCLCEMDGKLTLLDFKTTEKVIKHMTRVQLEAYRQMLRCFDVEIEAKYIVQISNGGKFRAEPHEVNDKPAWTIFTECLDLYRYIEQNG